MPMRRGQQVRDVLYDADAIGALERLAESNASLSAVVNNLGRRILNLPGVGLRVDGRRTYSLAFIRPRSPRVPRSRAKAFTGFTTPDYEGNWMPRVQIPCAWP